MLGNDIFCKLENCNLQSNQSGITQKGYIPNLIRPYQLLGCGIAEACSTIFRTWSREKYYGWFLVVKRASIVRIKELLTKAPFYQPLGSIRCLVHVSRIYVSPHHIINHSDFIRFLLPWFHKYSINIYVFLTCDPQLLWTNVPSCILLFQRCSRFASFIFSALS